MYWWKQVTTQKRQLLEIPKVGIRTTKHMPKNAGVLFFFFFFFFNSEPKCESLYWKWLCMYFLVCHCVIFAILLLIFRNIFVWYTKKEPCFLLQELEMCENFISNVYSLKSVIWVINADFLFQQPDGWNSPLWCCLYWALLYFICK